jgi:DNA-binding LacI/PurR family transcriptional regulator
MPKFSTARSSKTSTSRHPVTAYDVAHLAGVSQSAVSRAFTAGSSISIQTRTRVTAAALKLNYRPNLIARSLSIRRSNTIGVIVPPLDNPFFSSLLEALSSSFNRFGYRILLFTSNPAVSTDPILEDVMHSRVDALVMISASVSSSFAEECRVIGLPIVLLNRKTNGRQISSVTGANAEGAETIASFLLEGGHRRFAFMAGLEVSSTSRDREEAFTRRLAISGKRLSARATGRYSFETAMEAARQLLSVRLRPDAIFCANDYMALATIQIARHEFGLDVGRDISIVGFDDAEPAAWPLFNLTTFVQPAQLMADRVAHLLHRQLCTSEDAPSIEIVPGELIVRSSARKPKRGISGPDGRQTWKPFRKPETR